MLLFSQASRTRLRNSVWRDRQSLFTYVTVQCTQLAAEILASNFRPFLCQILTDYQFFFTVTFCGKFVTTCLLDILPHFNCVATLPCEIL